MVHVMCCSTWAFVSLNYGCCCSSSSCCACGCCFALGSQAFAEELKIAVPAVDLSSLPGFAKEDVPAGTEAHVEAKPLATTDDLHSLRIQASKVGIKEEAVMTCTESTGDLWRTPFEMSMEYA